MFLRSGRRRRSPNVKLEWHDPWSSSRTINSISLPKVIIKRLTAVQSVHENRIYSLKMHCGDNYPDEPPKIQFISQINLPCVNPRNGEVCSSRLWLWEPWKANMSLIGWSNEASMFGTMEERQYNGNCLDWVEKASRMNTCTFVSSRLTIAA